MTMLPIRLEPGNTIVIQPAGCDGYVSITTDPPGSAPVIRVRETSDAEETVFVMPYRFWHNVPELAAGSDGDGSQSEI